MNTQRWILHAAPQERTVQIEGRTGALRADPLGRTARGILILALVLGSLGAEAMALSSHDTSDHTRALQPVGSIHVGENAHLVKNKHFINRPWMY
jgi:hypothetical protein